MTNVIKNRVSTMPTVKQQQGMALIVVLMIVLLLMLVGTIAVRSSQTSLDMTTSAQVSQLLFQSSDVPVAKLENITDAQMAAMNDVSGPIGYLRTNGDKFNGAEYILCYQPTARASLYEGPKQHRVVANATGTTVLQQPNGYCQLTNNNAYTSKRGVVATQIAMTRPTITATLTDDVNVVNNEKTHTSQPFQVTLGTDLESVGNKDDVYVRAYATSVLPALAISSTVPNIEKCMKLPIGGLATNTKDSNQLLCLNATDTPYNVQVQDYMYIRDVAAAPAPAPAPAPVAGTG